MKIYNNEKRVFITGAAGFLDHTYVIIFKKHKVLGVDNLLTGSLKNLSHLKSNSDFEFREIDITHDFEIVDPIDYVLHFASPQAQLTI